MYIPVLAVVVNMTILGIFAKIHCLYYKPIVALITILASLKYLSITRNSLNTLRPNIKSLPAIKVTFIYVDFIPRPLVLDIVQHKRQLQDS